MKLRGMTNEGETVMLEVSTDCVWCREHADERDPNVIPVPDEEMHPLDPEPGKIHLVHEQCWEAIQRCRLGNG